MTTLTRQPTSKPVDVRTAPVQPVIALKRRTIDGLLIGIGAVATGALLVAGGLLTWGANFSSDYVGDELSEQKIAFPAAAALREEGRTDLLAFAGKSVDTGPEAEAYAGYIDGHLQGIANGDTFADLATPERTAKAASRPRPQAARHRDDRRAAGQGRRHHGQRNTLFKGETLRWLLLSAFAVDRRAHRGDRRHRRLPRRRRHDGPHRIRPAPPPQGRRADQLRTCGTGGAGRPVRCLRPDRV